jgi:hypothetical protein
MPVATVAQEQRLQTATENLSGIWNAWNPTPFELSQANWPIPLHTDVPATFLLFTDGKRFGGKAIVDNCPGFAEVTDGKIDGGNVSFTVIARAAANNQTSGETIYFTGKINGDEMDLVMRWPLGHSTFQLKMKARRFRHD